MRIVQLKRITKITETWENMSILVMDVVRFYFSIHYVVLLSIWLIYLELYEENLPTMIWHYAIALVFHFKKWGFKGRKY